MSDHLSPHERAMLDALQRSDTPDSTEQRRVKQRLFAELGLGVAGAATATAASHVSHAAAATTSSGGAVSTGAAVASGAGAGSNVGAAATLGAGTTSTAAAGGFTSGLLAKLGAAKLALGLGAVLTTAGGTAVWWSSQSASPLAVSSAAGSSAAGSSAAVSSAAGMQSSPNAPPVLVNPATLPEGPVVEAASKVDSTRPRGAESSTPPGRPTLKSSLEEEAQLLAAAQQRISQGDPRGALSVLSQHAKQFPRGALSLERQATVAIAHCLSGQTARGRGEAERFRRKHPNSPMVKRLESACKLDSP